MPVEIDAAANSTTVAHVVLAMVLVALAWLVFLGALFLIVRGRLPESQAEARARVRGQIAAGDFERMTIPATADVARALAQLAGRGATTVDEPPSVGGALADLRQAWRDQVRVVPRLALWAGYEAITLALLYGLVTVPVAAIRSGLFSGGGLPTGAEIQHAVSTATTTIVDVLALFPSTNIVWALLLTAGITLFDLLYQHALIAAAVLAGGALLITAGDRRSDDALETTLYPDRGGVVKRVASAAVAIWLVGAGIATAGNALGGIVGYPAIGNLVGASVALLVAGAFALHGATSLAARLRERHREIRDQRGYRFGDARGGGWTREDGLVAAYLLGRKALAGLGLALAPVVGAYAVRAVGSGSIGATIAAIAAAPLSTQAAVALIVVAILSLPLRLEPDAWRDLGSGIRIGLSRQGTRVRLAAVGGAGLAGVLIAFVALLFTAPWWAAGALGAATAWGSHKLWRLVARGAGRARSRSRDPSHPSYLSVALGRVDLGDEQLWVGRVGTRWLAWPEQDGVLQAMEHLLETRFAGDDPQPRVEAGFYDEVTSTGNTDAQAYLASQLVDAKARLNELVTDRDDPDIASVRSALESEFDPRIVDGALAEQVDDGSGVVPTGPISLDGDRLTWHGHHRTALGGDA